MLENAQVGGRQNAVCIDPQEASTIAEPKCQGGWSIKTILGLAATKEQSMTRSQYLQKLTIAALAILAVSCSSNNAQDGGSGGSRPSGVAHPAG